MTLNSELIGGLLIAPVIIWLGVIFFLRTLNGAITQIQSAILFMLCFFLLAAFVVLNLAVHNNVTLLTIAFVETVGLSVVLYFQLKKLLAKQ